MSNAIAVVPCYNGSRYLPATIRAIQRQSHAFSGVLVVDDGSTDTTFDIAKQLDCDVIRHESNMGLAAARNTGLRTVSTELIAFVDADVILEREWLKTLMPHVLNHDSAQAGGRLIEMHTDRAADAWRALHLTQDNGTADAMFHLRNPGRLAGFATLSRCEALRKVGGYNPIFAKAYEDVDICHRLIDCDYKLAYVPSATAYHARMDTVMTLLRSSWNWDFWPAYQNGCYRSFGTMLKRLVANTTTALSLARSHIQARRFGLLHIDATYLLTSCLWDAAFHLGQQNRSFRLLFGKQDKGNIGLTATGGAEACPGAGECVKPPDTLP